MLRKYELLYILKPDLSDDQFVAEQEYVRNAVTALKGEIKKEDAWGIKPLPYEIGKYREGFFCVMKLKMEPEGPSKLKYELKINDRILRNMLTTSK
ncbi:MAG: 30S ribosomal protein S6 [bacterium]